MPAVAPYDGACDPVFWDALLEHDPWVFHVSRRDHAESIAAHGLRVRDETAHSPTGEPGRSDAVYFGSRHLLAQGWLNEWTGIRAVDCVVVALELRRVDRARIVPDEDAWIEDMAGDDPSVLGVAPHTAGDGFADGGAWAQAMRLGSQPGSVEHSIAERERLAVLGSIAPDLLTNCGYGSAISGRPSSGEFPWTAEIRFLDARGYWTCTLCGARTFWSPGSDPVYAGYGPDAEVTCEACVAKYDAPGGEEPPC